MLDIAIDSLLLITPPLRVTAMRNRYLYNWAVYLMKNLIWSNSSVAILYCSRVYVSRCFDNHQSSEHYESMSKELSADMSKKHTGTMSTYCPAPLRSTPPLRVTAMRNRYLYNWAVYLMKNLIWSNSSVAILYCSRVIYEIIETSGYTRWFDYKPPPFWSNNLSQLLNLVQDVLRCYMAANFEE
ncbi:hypothetical protein DVH24_040099 [Malus domestica]|uniref:Uncharacterized protein n=1 Tax=Malus domestica TaxID=3750 RepID=A0A498I2S9_MALDO|nr:hypothetical protein DVH24_040099 [Malus domestica]